MEATKNTASRSKLEIKSNQRIKIARGCKRPGPWPERGKRQARLLIVPHRLVPTKALANLVRGKLRAALAKRRPDLVIPEAAWSKPWVVHCTSWGDGAEAVLEYVAR
jgi:hypothetical protein